MAFYPDHVNAFFSVRALVALLTLAIMYLIATSFGRRHVRVLTLAWLALPQMMISWMIYAADGVQSIYFVGLHLALYAAGIIVPLSYLEGLAFGIFTVLTYAVFCLCPSQWIR